MGRARQEGTQAQRVWWGLQVRQTHLHVGSASNDGQLWGSCERTSYKKGKRESEQASKQESKHSCWSKCYDHSFGASDTVCYWRGKPQINGQNETANLSAGNLKKKFAFEVFNSSRVC